MKNKISVIGGAGFLGTNFCTRLAHNNIDFEIIDLKLSNKFGTLSKVADIRDLSELRKAITGNIIVHLAAVHSDNIEDKSRYFDTNVNGTKNIIEVCREKHISKIIFTSSVAVYGFAAPGTGEEGEVRPFNEYGRTKYLAEEALRNWVLDSNNQLTIIRPTVIFGEGNRGNVHKLINQIAKRKFIMVGPGTNKKSLAYVKNIAAFLECCLENTKHYALYNYADSPNYTMNEFVRLIRKELHGKDKIGFRLPYRLALVLGYIFEYLNKFIGIKSPISAIRVRKFCTSSEFSSDKLELSGFIAPYSLSEGIANTLISDFIKPENNQEVFYSE